MAFFDKLGETIASVSKDVTQTAKEISGVAKLNIDIKAKEDYIQKQYAEIGKQYFDMHKDDETVMCPQFELIKEAMCSMEEMKKEGLSGRGVLVGDPMYDAFLTYEKKTNINCYTDYMLVLNYSWYCYLFLYTR